MFIDNFHSTYERQSTAETLKTIKQKHYESFQDYVKCFYNVRNAIPYMQDIEVINVFRDGVSDIKAVKEITMKKPKMVVDLLSVADICIEACEARARLLESRNKGPPRKKQRDDQEVNTVECRDHENRRNHGNRQQQPIEQKEKRLFLHRDDAEKWCEIHRTTGHNLDECKTFLYHKNMPASQVVQ
jgi:hypothetical protein